jgi:nucleolar complex protein 3
MSGMCLNTLNSVLRADMTGEPSLEVVRMLNQMIKERRFQIHPNVLTCLLNLRLKSELNVRASDSRADDSGRAGSSGQNKETRVRTKGKAANQLHLSKKARKALKERKEVEKEFREADAVVDKEERAARVGAILLTSPLFQC